MVPTLSESAEPPLPPSQLLLEAMLELEGMSPTLPEWSTLLRGLQMLTPTTEATTEATLDTVPGLTVASMVVQRLRR